MTIIESTAEDGVITLGDLLVLVMIFALPAWAQKQTTTNEDR